MEELRFLSDYKETDSYRRSFSDLAMKVFGINFEEWYEKGFWDDSYVCYSFFDRGEIAANVSASKLDIVMEGQKISAVQIGTVMTAPEFRNKGLAATLLNKVLEKYESIADIIYLFANESVLTFYPKFGFNMVRENSYSLRLDVSNSASPLRKLEPGSREDMEMIGRLYEKKALLSRKIDVEQAKGILLFHCLHTFRDSMYYSSQENAVLIYKIEGEKLHIYDVICTRKMLFHEVIGNIPCENIREIIFHFTPDFPDMKPSSRVKQAENDVLFVKNINTYLPRFFRLPVTSHA
ncbi:GNAT family N-acetyltransferase [Evansella clarkii]|uniref:GNAT family N-acetyltransferase n=1 Tax=Evansella clarkii TaxID=79879 RepID=UPI000B42DA67|nr:GNAT family N-acetyltransferase [Evansella clarkii]